MNRPCPAMTEHHQFSCNLIQHQMVHLQCQLYVELRQNVQQYAQRKDTEPAAVLCASCTLHAFNCNIKGETQGDGHYSNMWTHHGGISTKAITGSSVPGTGEQSTLKAPNSGFVHQYHGIRDS